MIDMFSYMLGVFTLPAVAGIGIIGVAFIRSIKDSGPKK